MSSERTQRVYTFWRSQPPVSESMAPRGLLRDSDPVIQAHFIIHVPNFKHTVPCCIRICGREGRRLSSAMHGLRRRREIRVTHNLNGNLKFTSVL